MPGVGTCVVCGVTFPQTRSPSTARKTCSRECLLAGRATHMAKTWAVGAMRQPDRRGMGKGAQNPNWKGGTPVVNGYRRVRVNGAYVREHRLVMERHIGRPLLPHEVVHHRNGDKLDNRIENLELIGSNSDHVREHYVDGTSRVARSRDATCSDCGDAFRTMNAGHGEQKFCLRCRRRARNRQ